MYYSKATGGFYDAAVHGARIPVDSVEITKEVHRALLDGQGAGQVIEADAQGAPYLAAPPVPPDSERRAGAKGKIDQAAGRARARYVSPGDLVDQEYMAAEAAAKEYRDAGYPVDQAPPEVQTWADATGNTTQWAADDIIATGAQWRAVLRAIRTIRLEGKAAVDAAAGDAIETTAAQYVAQLDSMAP